MSRKRLFYCGERCAECPHSPGKEAIELTDLSEHVCPLERPGCAQNLIEAPSGGLLWKSLLFAVLGLGAISFVIHHFRTPKLTASTPEVVEHVETKAPTKPTVITPPQPETVTPPPPVERVMLSMEAPSGPATDLLPALAEAFLKQRGLRDVNSISDGKIMHVSGLALSAPERHAITIKIAKESDAFLHLAKSDCHLAIAWREPTLEEAARLAPVCDARSASCLHVLAFDAPAVLVAKDNPASAITLKQLADIWQGNLVDWSDLGGTGQIELHLLKEGHPASNLFPAALRDHQIMRGRIHRHDTPESLSDAVAADVHAIGLASMRQIRNARALAVSEDVGTESLIPAPFTVASGDYLFTRRLVVYSPTKPTSQWTVDFIQFACGEKGEGQTIVAQRDYVDQRPRQQRETLPSIYLDAPDFPPALKALAHTAVRISTTFRFAFKSDEPILDAQGEADLLRLVRRLDEPDIQGKPVLLAGFADKRLSEGQTEESVNVPLSFRRADKVGKRLAESRIKASAILPMGSKLPISLRDDEVGWALNRRVEVWVLDPAAR